MVPKGNPEAQPIQYGHSSSVKVGGVSQSVPPQGQELKQSPGLFY